MSELSLNFKYKFEKDYNPVYVNGAYGGIGPKGEFVINFFFERTPVPYTETVKLDEEGKFLGLVAVKPEDHPTNVIRYVSTGVVLNLQAAREIHEWLGKQLDAIENTEGGAK